MHVSSAAPLGDDTYSRGYVWYVVVLLATVNMVNYMDRMVLAVLAPRIKEELHLSDSQLGLLIGFAFSLFYAICGLPIARWADRGSRRSIIALALSIWSAMTVLCGIAQNFLHLFLARMGLGAGEAGCMPPAQSLLCDYVPLQRRPAAFAILSFGLIAGMMVGMVLAGWLGSTLGWRATFVVLGLPGILLAFVVRLTLKEPRRGRWDGAAANARALSLTDTLVALWRCKTYRRLTILYAMNGFVLYGSTQWWPSFYVRIHELSLSSVGTFLGLAIGTGSGIGLLLGGALASKAGRRDSRYPLWIGAIATALAFPAALATLFVSSAETSLRLVALTTLLWSVSSGPVVATAMSVVAPAHRATAAAINVFFGAALGFGLGPLCVGVASDLLSASFAQAALRYALLLPLALLPLMALLLKGAGQSVERDLGRMRIRVGEPIG